MNLLKNLLSGDVPLGRVCWGFCLAPFVLSNLAYVYIGSQTEQFSTEPGIFLQVCFMVFGIIYWPFIAVAIWRSAEKYSGHVANQIVAKFVAGFAVAIWGTQIVQIFT
jgi:hypothetical protein